MQTYSIFGPTIYNSSETSNSASTTPLFTSYLSNILQYISSFLDYLSSEESTEQPTTDSENPVIYIDDDSLFRSGLSLSQINEVTTIEYLESASEEFECSICQDKVTSGVYRKLNGCSHKFHIQCIDNWLENHSTCPICRQELLPNNSGTSRLFRNIISHLRTTIASRPSQTDSSA